VQHSVNLVSNPTHSASPLTILFRSVVAMASVRLHVLFFMAAISPIRQHFVSSAFGFFFATEDKKLALDDGVI
jgi:hypothetical protein